jgi:hypothetical protein
MADAPEDRVQVLAADSSMVGIMDRKEANVCDRTMPANRDNTSKVLAFKRKITVLTNFPKLTSASLTQNLPWEDVCDALSDFQ